MPNELKKQNSLNQFDRNIFALLAFDLDYAEPPEQVSGDGDTWEVRIEMSSAPTFITKYNADTYFPDNTKQEIAVKFVAGELDATGEFRYQVVKTTGGIENYSNIRSYTVQESLMDSPVNAPYEPPATGAIPMYDVSGRLIESKIIDTGNGLEYDGSALGGDMFKSEYDTDGDGIVDQAVLAENADKLGDVPASHYQLKPEIKTISDNSYIVISSDNYKILRFTNADTISLRIDPDMDVPFFVLIESVSAIVEVIESGGVSIPQPDKTVSATKAATLYSTTLNIFKLQGATE